MKKTFSRRSFLNTTAKTAAVASLAATAGATGVRAFHLMEVKSAVPAKRDRIVDIHTHFDSANPQYLDDFLRMSDQLNVTGCMLTLFANRKVVAEAAKKYPGQIIPFGYIDLDAPDVAQQVEELHGLGYRGLGELEFVKKDYNNPAYFPVYELANKYKWVILFHTGIVLRAKFHEPEDVASLRMRAIYLEEIARRFPQITVIGAHCGNPEYEWAAEISRWNPNVFFDLSGSSLKKLRGRLTDVSRYFWWSNTDEGSDQPNNDPSAFTKLVFGSDTSPQDVEKVLAQYRADVRRRQCVPESARKLVLGGTLAKILGMPD